MASIVCAQCGAARPEEDRNIVPRPPCAQCGSTTVQMSGEASDALSTVTASVSFNLIPGDQALDWRRQWKEIQREQGALAAGRTGPVSSDAIHAAREDLLSFYVLAYHLKDALKAQSGIAPKDIEAAITADPDLSILADLANLHKHGTLTKPPRSGFVPTFGPVSGSTADEDKGWRLNLEIMHDGAQRDGLDCAARAVAAWRKHLATWGLS